MAGTRNNTELDEIVKSVRKVGSTYAKFQVNETVQIIKKAERRGKKDAK